MLILKLFTLRKVRILGNVLQTFPYGFFDDEMIIEIVLL